MNNIPVLMVLYTNDATEIRYSDGSCLELSPCGSTLIHHNPLKRGEHPKHETASKIQKRLRFVTSEHRQKVLQAMDFRNRFADRPYLCKELIDKDDLIALYAKIDQLAWPRSIEEAKVEVLHDGSRKLVSLDEYASIITSPHGQDFTVCYLSRVSEDSNNVKGSFSQMTKSMHSSQRSPDSARTGMKPNEAVVHPFHANNEVSDCALKKRSECVGGNISQNDTAKENSGETQHQDQHNKLKHDSKFEDSSGVVVANAKSKSLREPKVKDPSRNEEENIVSTVKHKCAIKGGQSLGVVTESFKSKCASQASQNFCPESVPCQRYGVLESSKTCQASMDPLPTDSPSSHEISSISRSSTPDGLRTTIETDSILSHDSSEAKALMFEQRHSSPANNGTQADPFVKKFNSIARMQDVSLSGSFLGNQNENKQEDQQTLAHSSDPGLRSSLENEHSLTLLGDNSDSPSGGVSVNVNSTLCDQTDKTPELSNCIENTTCNKDCAVEHEQNQQVQQLSPLRTGSQLPTMIPHNEQLGFLPWTEDTTASLPVHTEAEKSSGRSLYVWTTQHISRSSCPTRWTHPLKLVMEAQTSKGTDDVPRPNIQHLKAGSSMQKLDSRMCHMTTPPTPLSLTCPFQHLHKWASPQSLDTEDNRDFSTVGEFKRGNLKVIISEGIVYRLNQARDLKVVEIYPGDGSFLISQGPRAHFFTHYLLVGDQLEERTYSLKSLPPEFPRGKYSIGKLIKTASRFFLMQVQREERERKEVTPCWAKEVVAIVEPLSASLLEECQVEGLGQFSAFTNGRVHIVFEDRTILDMALNFSDRVENCIKHSQEPRTPAVRGPESLMGPMTCRLLLPSGQYITVDTLNPGKFTKYIQAADEWGQWVKASPEERQTFYSQQHMPSIMRQAAEIELKKIFCFNHILELMHDISPSQLATSHHPATHHPATHHPATHHPATHHPATHHPATHHPVTHHPATHHPATHQPATHHPLPKWPSLTVNQNPVHRSLSPFMAEKTPECNLPRTTLRAAPTPISRPHPHTAHQQALSSNQTFRKLDAAIPGALPTSIYPSRPSPKTLEVLQGFQSVQQVLKQTSNMISDIDTFLESSKNA